MRTRPDIIFTAVTYDTLFLYVSLFCELARLLLNKLIYSNTEKYNNYYTLYIKM